MPDSGNRNAGTIDRRHGSGPGPDRPNESAGDRRPGFLWRTPVTAPTTSTGVSRTGPDAGARSTRTVLLAALAGAAMAILWSPHLVDRVIAEGMAGPILGPDLAEFPLVGAGSALLFALVTGAAGMFTACNVAVFSALAPVTSGVGGRAAALRAVVALVAGAVLVGGLYGAIGVHLGDVSAQLSSERLGDAETGLPVRMIQAAIVFGLVGAIMLWRGLAYAELVRNPLAGLFARRPWTEQALLGGLVGVFLVGRPYPPFRHLYAYAASTGDSLLGFATFALQSLGNVVGVVLLYALVLAVSRGRVTAWMNRVPGRAARVAAASFVVVGAFLIVYWAVRLPARAGVMWWPVMPWNA
jgi:hypothetical protein